MSACLWVPCNPLCTCPLQAYGAVPVRVRLPGRLVLQAAFAATETIGAVQVGAGEGCSACWLCVRACMHACDWQQVGRHSSPNAPAAALHLLLQLHQWVALHLAS